MTDGRQHGLLGPGPSAPDAVKASLLDALHHEHALPVPAAGHRTALRVLIVDDHRIMRDGLRGLLDWEPDIKVVGEAGDALRAVVLAGELLPDVVVMDVNLGSVSGVEATRQITARFPGVKVIGLSMNADAHVASKMRAAGAAAYLTKGGSSQDLIDAIRACRKP